MDKKTTPPTTEWTISQNTATSGSGKTPVSGARSIVPTKDAHEVHVDARKVDVKSIQVVDTDFVLTLKSGRQILVRDGALKTATDEDFKLVFQDEDVSGKDLFSASELSTTGSTSTWGDATQDLAPVQAAAAPVEEKTSNLTLIAGGLLLLAAAGGGGGGGGSSSNNNNSNNTNTGLTNIQTYADLNTDPTAQHGTAPTQSDYTTAGVTGVTSSNISAINSALATQAITAASVATTAQVQALVNAYASVLAMADGTAGNTASANRPTAGNYTQIGITGIDTAAKASLLDDVIDGKQAADVSNAAQIQALADNVSAVMNAVATGTGLTLAQLQALGITGSNVTASNLPAILQAIASTASDGSGVDTQAELQTVVNNAANNAAAAFTTIEQYADNNGGTTPSTATYAATGTTGVTTGNVAAINSALATTGVTSTNVDTQPEIQAIVNSYNKILAMADGTAGNTPAANSATAVDYANIGITGLTGVANASAKLGLLDNAIDALPNTAVDTAPEVQALADAAGAVITGAAGGTAPTLQQLQALGITGVTATNLAAVQAAIAGTADDGSGVDTLGELQGIVNGVVNSTAAAISAIMAYADANSSPAPTAPTGTAPTTSTYQSAGVTGVTSNNINAINDALASATVVGASVNSTTSIQALVDAYNSVLTMADGTAGNASANGHTPTTAGQYALIGVTGVNTGTNSIAKTSLLDNVIDGKQNADVDTVNEVQSLADAVAAVMNNASGSGSTGPTLAQLSALGITGATADNLPAIWQAIAATADDGTAVDTQALLQGVVSAAATNAAAALSTISTYAGNNTDPANPSSTGAPTTGTYTAAGVTGVTASNLASINDVFATAGVNAAAADTTAEVQAIVNAENSILNMANGLAGDTAAANRPNSAQYALVGITGIDGTANASAKAGLLDDVIDGLSFSAVDTSPEVQTLADAAAAVITGAAGGTAPTLQQLQALGISGVNASNLTAVQTAIASTADDGSGVDTKAELQTVVNNAIGVSNAALAVIQTYADANASPAPATPTGTAPTATDYANAGVTGVNSGNIASINDALASAAVTGSSLPDVPSVQALVNAYNSVLSMADGTPGNATNPTSAAQYGLIGITGMSGTGVANPTAKASLLDTVIDGKQNADVNTVNEIQALASAAEAVVDNAAGGTGITLAQLNALGITGATADNLPAIQQAITATADDGSGVNTKALLQSLVTNAANAASAALSTISSYADANTNPNGPFTGTAPTTATYTAAGVTGVTSNNVASINDALATAYVNGAAADTTGEVQALVNAYNGILALADGVDNTANSANPAASQYTLIGVTGVDSAVKASLLGDVIDVQPNSAVSTIPGIQNLANAVADVMAAAAGSVGKPTVAELNALGFTNVNANNISQVQAAIAQTADDGTGVDTLPELTYVINNAVGNASAALQRIEDYAQYNTQSAPVAPNNAYPAPSVTDYSTIGVTGVNNSNLAAINDALTTANVTGASVNSTANVQNLVSAYVSILGLADGIAGDGYSVAASQYALIGANIGNAANNTADGANRLSLLNSIIDGQSFSGVDTVNEINNLAQIANAIQDIATGTTPSYTLQPSDFATAGISGVTSGNIAAVEAAIAGAGATNADTLSEIQNLVYGALSLTFNTIATDTGFSSTDHVTSDNTLTFSGTTSAADGTTVKVVLTNSSNAVVATLTTTASGGTWSVADPAALADGTYTVSASLVNGSTTLQTATPGTVTVDTSVTSADTGIYGKSISFDAITQDTGTVGDFITSDQTLVFSGTSTAAAGSHVLLKIDGNNYYTTVQAGGTWSYDNTANALTGGSHTVQAFLVDAADNVAASSGSRNVVINTNPLTLTSETHGAIASTANLVLGFSDNVTADTTGTKYITIYKVSDNSVVEQIAVNSSQVTVNGNVVTVDPNTTLTVGTAYYANIDSGAFSSTSSTYTGLIDNTSTTHSWTFTPADPVTTVTYGGTGVDATNGINAAELANLLISGTVSSAQFSSLTNLQIASITFTPDSGSSFTINSNLPTINSTNHTWTLAHDSSWINQLVSGHNYTVSVTLSSSIQGTPSTSVAYSPTTLIDTVDPSVIITSDHSALKVGDTATVTLTFSEAPSGLTLSDLSASHGTLSNLSVSASNPLVYTATYAPANSYTGTDTITIGAGSYTDAVGNPGIAGSSSSLSIDTQPPVVSSVTISGVDGTTSAAKTTLVAGDKVMVTVTMDQATTVTGSPTYAINVGGVTENATYASGSGTNTLVFYYTVQVGDNDITGGITASANALAANGGTLQDAAGNTATLTTSAIAPNTNSVVVDTTYTALNTLAAAADANNATATTPDISVYTRAGATNAVSSHLSAYNSALDSAAVVGTSVDTTPEVQALVKAYNDIFTLADGIDNTANSANPSAAEYTAIGVTGLSGNTIVNGNTITAATKASLLGDVIDLKNASDISTEPQVQALADAVSAVMSGAAGGTGPTQAQLTLLGITGVTPDNLATVQAAIAGTPHHDGTDVDTLGELQNLVQSAINGSTNAAITAIANYADANSSPAPATPVVPSTGTPTVSTYNNAGVTGVTSANVASINDALASATVVGTSVDTTAEIQALVNAYTSVLAMADGTANNTIAANQTTAAQYGLIGITGLADTIVNGSTIAAATKTSLLDSVIDSKQNADVDTVNEIQALVAATNAVMTGAAGGTGPTQAQLALLGITGVTADNLPAVLQAIAATTDDGTAVDTQALLQGVVNTAVTNAAAALTTISTYAGNNTDPSNPSSTGAPTLATYTAAGVTGVNNAATLASINDVLATSVVNAAAADTTAEVQAIVNAENSILNMANGTAGDTAAANRPTSAQYALVGITGIDGTPNASAKAALLDDVIDGLPLTAVDTSPEVQALATAAAAVITGAAGGTAPTQQQLEALGITGVNPGNIAAVQAAIANTADDGSGVDTKAELQTLVNNVINSVPQATATITGAYDHVAPVIGNVTSGSSTNDTEPTLSGGIVGNLSTGDTVHIFDGSTDLGAATVTTTTTNGVTTATWSLTPATALAQGTHNLTAVVVNSANNQGTASSVYAITVDTTAPTATASLTNIVDDVAPITGTVAPNGSTNDNTPTLSGAVTGTLNAGEAVHVFDGSTDLGAATLTTTTSGGVTTTTWSMTTGTLSDGSHSFTAAVIDAAGNKGSASSAYAITVDTMAPTATAAITNAYDDVAPVIGNVASGGSTNDTTPTLSGTITGTLGAGEVVHVFDGGTDLGAATTTNNGTTWNLTPATALSGGTHNFYVAVVDAAGNVGALTNTAYTLTISTSAPTEIVTDAALSVDSGASSTDFITNVAAQTISGHLSAALAAGDTVSVSLDNGTTWTTATATTGTTSWSLSGVTLSGSNTLQVKVTNAAGLNSTPIYTHTYTLDTTAPTETVASANLSNDTGTSNSDFITNVASQTISGNLSAALAAGDTVYVSLDNGTTWTAATATTGTTSWSLSGVTLSGSNTLQVKVSDIAGNTSTPIYTHTYTLDTTAPTATAAITGAYDDVAPGIGNVASGGSTNDNTPALSGSITGTLGTGETVHIFDGSTDLGAATVTGSSWSLTTGILADGSHTLTAAVVDTAGNVGTASSAYTLNINTSAVTKTATIGNAYDDVAPVIGYVTSGGTTNDSTPTLSGAISATLGTGESVHVYDGSTDLGAATVTGLTWSLTTPTLTNGAHSFTAAVVNTGGTQGTASAAYTLTVDTIAPTATAAITGAYDDVAPVIGNVASGGTTNDSTPTLSGSLTGTLGTGETIHIFDGSTDLGAATVSGTSWSLTTQALSSGTHSFTAAVVDAAGNQGNASSAYTLTIDTSVPAETVTAASLSADTGASNSDFITKTAAQTITGSLSTNLAAGDTVYVSLDNGATWTAATAATGATTWSLTGATLNGGVDGSNTLQIKVTNAAGISSTPIYTHAYTLDTTAPTEYVSDAALSADTGTSNSDFITNIASQTISGHLSANLAAGDTVYVSLDNGSTWTAASATVGSNTWSLSGATLNGGVNGSNTLKVKVTDTAGNDSAAFSHSYTFDTTTLPTTVSAISGYAESVGAITGTEASPLTIPTTDASTVELVGTNGTLQAGEAVWVYKDGTYLGTAAAIDATHWKLTGVTVDTTGHTYTVKVANAAGNTLAGTGSQTLALDTTPPTTVSAIVGYAESVGSVTGTEASPLTITTTDASTVELVGTNGALQAGEAIWVYKDGTFLATAAAIDATHWKLTGVTTDTTGHTYTVRVADAAGNTFAGTGSQSITLDTTPPSEYATNAVLSADTGTSSTDLITSVASQTITGTLSGNVATGDIVYVSLNNGATWTAASATVGTNTWSLSGVTLNGGTDGSNTLLVKVSDAAGNTNSTVYTHTYTLDTTAPTTVSAIVGYAESVGSVTGTEASPLTITTTDASTVELVGTNGVLQTGEAVWVYKDGTYLGTASAIDSTHWKLTGVTVDTSGHIYTVKVTDAAGNTLAGSGSQSLALDTMPPSEYVTGAVLSADTGISNTDFITNVAAQTITGTLSGNVATGDTVYVSLNGGSTWTVASASVGTSTWTLANATLLSGTNTLLVKVSDAAGNTSTPVYTQAYTYSNATPSFSSFTINSAITTDTASTNTALGVSGTTFGGTTPQNSDGITRDTSLVLTGTVSGVTAGDVLQYSTNGGTTWNNATLAGTGATTWTVADATAQTTTGTVTYSFRVMSAAGNIQTIVTTKAVTIDVTAPVMAIKAPVLSTANDTGTVGDNTTTATSLTFTSATQGTGEAGATVALISDVNNEGIYDPLVDKVLGTATVASNGSWSITNGTALTTGSYNLGFVEYDAAGNYTRLTQTTTINIVANDGATTTGGLSVSSGLTAWTSTGISANTNMAVGFDATGNLLLGVNAAVIKQSSSTAGSVVYSGGSTSYNYETTYVDFNRDGYTDLVGSKVGNSTLAYWQGSSSGTYTAGTVATNSATYATVAWDYNGDGWVDFMSSGGTGTMATNDIVKNANGTLSMANLPILQSNGSTVESSIIYSYSISTADFFNNGVIDLAIGSGYNNNLYLVGNNGTGTLTEIQALSSAVQNSGFAGMVWADFTGSGYVSLYTTVTHYANWNGYLYVNNGNGTFNASGTIVGNNSTYYFAGAAIDWNHDGAMDIVRMDVSGADTIELNTNNGSGTFTTANLTASGTAITTAGAVQSISTADVNWDGAADLVYTSGTQVYTVLNTNAVQNGTSLNIKISDPNGINSYFGNTVKLFDTTTGKLVSTQVLNQQDGLYYNDSTGILHFYGLNANDTYSVVLIRSTGSGNTYVSNDVGGQASYVDSSASTLFTVENVDSTWGGLKTSTANSAINLIADGGASTSSTANFVGTGYNDTFTLENLSNASKVASGGTPVTTEKFNGGGGWSLGLGGTASTWSASGGMNVVDLTQAGSNAVVVNLNTGTGSVSGSWSETLGFNSIQGIKLGAGTATVTDGGTGDNEFWLGAGQTSLTLGNVTGHDVLVFNQLASTASGGFNAGNTVAGFTVGAVTTTAKSSILDLRGVLKGYAGTATVYWDVTTSQYVLDQDSRGLLQYLNIVVSGSNTLVQVDATGNGNWQTIATLSGVSTNLATLIGNNQLWVASSALNLITVASETTTSTTPTVHGTLDPSITQASGITVQVTLNGTTYSSATGAITVDYTNNAWFFKSTTALATGTYDVAASVINSTGSTISNDTTTNELTVVATPAGFNSGLSAVVTPASDAWHYTDMVAGTDSNGNLILLTGTNLLTQTSATTLSNKVVSINSAGNTNSASQVLFDFNRDGQTDFASVKGYDGTTSNNPYVSAGGSYTTGSTVSMTNDHSGVPMIAWDEYGSGYVGLAVGAVYGTNPNGGFIINNSGTLSQNGTNGLAGLKSTSGSTVTNFAQDQGISGVDLNNDGTVDIGALVYGSNMSTNALSLITIYNYGNTSTGANTTTGLVEHQEIDNAFNNVAENQIASPMLWADFNGSGYLSLYLPETALGNNTNGRVFINSAGTLVSNTSVGNAFNAYVATLVDWNHDGRMDVVKMDHAAAGNIELDTVTGNAVFTPSYLTSGGATVTTLGPVNGVVAVDANWDGATDLVYVYSSTTGANSTANLVTVLNTNAVTNGTSLNIKISDPNGINSYFGNTVKLFDTTTNTLVSTQVINEQTGIWGNDSTGILHFYGLNASDTYSVVMIRNTNGASNDVGGQSSYTDSSAAVLTNVENVDATWGNIHTSAANTALDLVATGGANTSSTNSFVGTGYNDTLFAVTGTNASTYNGGGGWSTDSYGTQTWTSAGGMNVLDFTKAGSSAVTLDLSSSAAQTAVSGWGTVTLANIEGVAGGSGNDTFTNSGGNDQMQGRGGNNTYNLTNAGGHDTLLYTVQTAASNTGGNGPDVANSFHLGMYQTDADADLINLKALLSGYTAGAGASYVNGVATINSGETIGNYLTVTNSGSDTIISIDRDGTGSTYSSAQLLTLHNVTTNLATLMANHQIIVA